MNKGVVFLVGFLILQEVSIATMGPDHSDDPYYAHCYTMLCNENVLYIELKSSQHELIKKFTTAPIVKPFNAMQVNHNATLAAILAENMIHIINLNTELFIKKIPFKWEYSYSDSWCWSKDNSLIARQNDKHIKIINLNTLKCYELPTKFKGELSFSEDNELLICQNNKKPNDYMQWNFKSNSVLHVRPQIWQALIK